MKKYLIIITILNFLFMPIIAVLAQGYAVEVEIPTPEGGAQWQCPEPKGLYGDEAACNASCDVACGQYFTLSTYLRNIFIFLLSATGIIAMLAIMIAGYQYMTAAGNASKIEDAKGRIKSAIMGLVLALASYLILYMINPDLVALRLPEAEPIDPCLVKQGEHLEGSVLEAEAECFGAYQSAKCGTDEIAVFRPQPQWDKCCFCQAKEEGGEGAGMADVKEGSQCRGTEDCQYDLQCQEKGGKNVCVAVDIPEGKIAFNTACTIDQSNRQDDCFDPRLICKSIFWAKDKCEPPVKRGEQCDYDGECCKAEDKAPTCIGITEDLLCNQRNDRCYPPGGLGSPCERPEECISGVCGGNNKCTGPTPIEPSESGQYRWGIDCVGEQIQVGGEWIFLSEFAETYCLGEKPGDNYQCCGKYEACEAGTTWNGTICE